MDIEAILWALLGQQIFPRIRTAKTCKLPVAVCERCDQTGNLGSGIWLFISGLAVWPGRSRSWRSISLVPRVFS